jgi:hypothetical protein
MREEEIGGILDLLCYGWLYQLSDIAHGNKNLLMKSKNKLKVTNTSR